MTTPIAEPKALPLREWHANPVRYAWMANAFRTAVLVPRRFARRVPGIRASILKGVILQTAVHVGIRVKVANRSIRR